MTHHPIQVLDDGTRVYSNGTRYRPKAPDAWAKGRPRKPSPEALWWGGLWVLPMAFLPGDQRLWPATRPDTDAYDHVVKPRRCRCAVCQRPEAHRWRLKGRRDLRSGQHPLAR